MSTTTLPEPELDGPTTSAVELSPEQADACEQITDWFFKEESKEFRLGGYAGTGKTTLARVILDQIIDGGYLPAVCAPTGKAASVLRRKGISDARTIHSTIYKPASPDSPEWVLKSPLDFEVPDLFVVDEASMIPTDLYNDLRSFNRPILFIGDPGQLEPVGENPNLMAEPDFVLQTIHRQAAGNPILQLAQSIREGAIPQPGFKHPQLVTTTWPLPMKNLLMADQVLCGTNAVRRNWNTAIRAEKGFDPGKLVVPGEKLIILRNENNLGIHNGQIIFVDRVRREYDDAIYVDATDETGARLLDLKLWPKGLRGETPSFTNRLPRKCAYVDYGYVITCHKSQGSEWDKVVVVDPGQIGTWDMRRWRYTAVTRAANALLYCL